MEGIAYPENSRYWMEPIGDEDAWVMHISGYPKGRDAAKVVDLDPRENDKYRQPRTKIT
jgi:hypothetical protein